MFTTLEQVAAWYAGAKLLASVLALLALLVYLDREGPLWLDTFRPWRGLAC